MDTVPMDHERIGNPDRMLGREAVARGWVSEERLEAAVRAQEREVEEGNPERLLGAILLERGDLAEDQVTDLLDEQLRALVREEDVLFGETLVRNDLAARADVEEALRLQETQRVPRRLGEILVEQGRLTRQAMSATLKAQGRMCRKLERPAAPDGRKGLERVGRYRILRRLGGGGMGDIYLALQEDLGREVAIKVLPRELSQDREAISRFRQEVEVVARLAHPNICPVYEAGEDGAIHFYAMERLGGLDLDTLVKTQRIDPRRAAEIARQTAEALHFAHQNGVIHRDVKPLNIIVTRGRARRGSSGRGGERKPAGARIEGQAGGTASESALKMPSPEFQDHVYLIDFGLARQEGSHRLTATGALLGTPAYMAPEQAAGRGAEVGPRTDVYGAGAVLYEMLTLHAPFEGRQLGEVLRKVAEDDPVPPRRLRADCPADLEVIALKCLEKDPARRYPSAEALAADLGRFLADEPIEARPAGRLYRLYRKVMRHKLAAGLLALAAVLVTALGLVTLGPARVSIASDPTGAAVRIDGEETGLRTPVASRLLWPPGMHVIGLELEGFEPFEKGVKLAALASEDLRYPLVRRKGKLDVYGVQERVTMRAYADAGGQPRVFDVPGTGIDLDVGTWRLVFEKENCFGDEKTVEVRHAETTNVNTNVRPILRWSFQTGGMIESSTCVADVTGDGRLEVVATSNDGCVYLLDAAEGRAIWRWEAGSAVTSSAAVADLDGDGPADPRESVPTRPLFRSRRRGMIRDAMGLVHVEATVTGPRKRRARVEFLVDSGAKYSLLPRKVWKALALKPKRRLRFTLADGTVIERNVSECHFQISGIDGHSPVILGESKDEALLGIVTLESLGLVLNPFERTLQPARMMLA